MDITNEMVEQIARAINPAAFRARDGLYNYCRDRGDSHEVALKCAENTWKNEVEPVLENTRKALVYFMEHKND